MKHYKSVSSTDIDETRKEIEARREIKEKVEANELVSICCEHILAASPHSMDVKNLKINPQHPKHDGNIYCCSDCARMFDNLLLARPDGYHALPFRRFEKNIRSVQDI